MPRAWGPPLGSCWFFFHFFPFNQWNSCNVMSCRNWQASLTYQRPSDWAPLLSFLFLLKWTQKLPLTSFHIVSNSSWIWQLTANTLSSRPVQSCFHFSCELVSPVVLWLSSQMSSTLLTPFHPIGLLFSKRIILPSIPWTILDLHYKKFPSVQKKSRRWRAP